jgi:hypothetical protein
MTLEEVRGVLGGHMQRWEPTAGQLNAPAYYIGFTNTNASFRMGADDRVLSIYKSDQA